MNNAIGSILVCSSDGAVSSGKAANLEQAIDWYVFDRDDDVLDDLRPRIMAHPDGVIVDATSGPVLNLNANSQATTTDVPIEANSFKCDECVSKANVSVSFDMSTDDVDVANY
jgi:hypothetical protein